MKSRYIFTACLVGAALVVFGLCFSPFGEIIRWKIDQISRYRLAYPTEHIQGYDITLIQEPCKDFYHSYFEIVGPSGDTNRFTVDGDDYRWKDPQMRVIGDRIYYMSGTAPTSDDASFVDRKSGIVFGGYYKRTLLLADIGKTEQGAAASRGMQ